MNKITKNFKTNKVLVFVTREFNAADGELFVHYTFSQMPWNNIWKLSFLVRSALILERYLTFKSSVTNIRRDKRERGGHF